MNDQNPPNALPTLDDLKRTLRITSPVTHAPSHGTWQFGTSLPRAKQPTHSHADLIALAAIDINAGEWNY